MMINHVGQKTWAFQRRDVDTSPAPRAAEFFVETPLPPGDPEGGQRGGMTIPEMAEAGLTADEIGAIIEQRASGTDHGEKD